MKKLLPAIVVLFFLCLCTMVFVRYQSSNAGKLLAEEYFTAVPASGYGTQRALTPARLVDADASILQQGIKYHQRGDFDLALVSLRAYLEDNSAVRDHLPVFLAGTAAFATGQYGEAREFYNGIGQETREARSNGLWLGALLTLREEDLAGARRQLERLVEIDPNGYPAREMLTKLP